MYGRMCFNEHGSYGNIERGGKKRRANHWMILEKNFCRYIALKGHFVIKFYKDRVMWRAGKLKGRFVL